MTLEEDIVSAISSLVGGRVFYMTAPFNTPRPFILYSHVGGRPTYTFCGDTTKQNARIQFNVWDKIEASSAAQSVDIMRQLAAIVTVAPLRATSQGGLQSVYDEATKTYGTRMDFSFWA